jgi:hypothetical protein
MLLAVFAGCGQSGSVSPAASDTTAAAAQESTSAAEETSAAIEYKAAAPDRDFGGEDFNVATVQPDNPDSLVLTFDPEAETGDVVNDSIYNRNRKIEEKYNVKFLSTYPGDYTKMLPLTKKMTQAGEDTYQLIMLINREAFSAAVSGYLMAQDSIPYQDLTQPYYCQDINSQLSIGNKLLFSYTDECMNMYMQTICTFFNKGLVQNYNLGDLYQIVRDGKFTTEEFYSLSEAVIKDVNGDSAYTEDGGDVFGVASEDDMFYPSLWIGANSMTVTKDSDDLPVYSAPTDEKLIGILDRLTEELKKDGFRTHSDYAGDQKYFISNGALFLVGCIGWIVNMRSMDADFGILPLPKYDEAQDKYYSRMIDGWVHVAPITVQDTELLGTMIEALGAESKNYVIPAYFDIALTNKYTRDTDSEEMLNMVFNNVTLDLGDTAWYDTIRSQLTNAITSGKGGYASTLEKYRNKVQKNCIDKSLKALGLE